MIHAIIKRIFPIEKRVKNNTSNAKNAIKAYMPNITSRPQILLLSVFLAQYKKNIANRKIIIFTTVIFKSSFEFFICLLYNIYFNFSRIIPSFVLFFHLF